MRNYIIIVLAIFTIICCDIPDVKFLEPQPLDKKNLNSFPNRYQGKYLSNSDSSLLTITSEVIFKEWNGIAKISRAELNEELDTIYENNVEIEFGNNWIMKIEIEGDSAVVITYGIDTVFMISENTILRSFKGYLFLNARQIDSTWNIETMKLENKKLDFSELIALDQIDSLKQVTNILTEVDSESNRINNHKLNPKKKELKEILRRKEKENQYRKL